MSRPLAYTTVAARAEAEIEIDRSRFIAVIERIDDEAAARGVIAEVRADHPRARHHCTAFRIGVDGQIARSSDDGEPSGTAGLPMLEALRGEGLSDVVAVVSRYFGGVLLGTGGLVRAYTAAVQEAAAHATRVDRVLRTLVAVDTDYERGPALEAELRRRSWVPHHIEYGDAMRLEVAVPPAELAPFGALIAELTAGASRIDTGETIYVDRAPG